MTFKPLSEKFYADNEDSLEQENKPSDGGSQTGKTEPKLPKSIALIETTNLKDPELTMTMLVTVENDEELTMKLNLKGSNAALTG